MTSGNCLISVFAAAALVTSSGAVGQSQSNNDDSKVVCKTQAKTGTRFKDKICRTQLQWEQIRIQSQRDAKEMIDRPQIETRRGG